ncbi:hypothetical protein TSUD_320580 [Trifolium subterraneum]|uniref:RNase H type-1 domain-containing protein n=1 Tax=Trifolium subterraneum TaxID=3900 RepID=A0A2Z6MZ98_TRISU|nr:hypothetical protein TSUD_320580 [Trifolium subterraneum]
MFNEALLAKQGWRIATQPTLLVAKVLKAKYFPKSHFLEAKMGNIISYTWRSILHASWILKKDCYWTIGNGEQVNIWEDNWLPLQNGYKVWSPPWGSLNGSKVKELIDPDELTWFGTKDGTYSVKSGYQAIMDWTTLNTDNSGSNTLATDPTWNNLWKQKIPLKQAHLLWRILHQALPVKNNLSSKGIQCNPICPRCNNGLETIDHVFMHCEWVKGVWFGSPMTIQFNETHHSFSEWVSKIINNEAKEAIANISALIYNIWRARNLLVFQEKNIPIMCVIQQDMAASQEYSNLGGTTPHHSSSSTSGTRGKNNYWIPPTCTAVKLNVDSYPSDDGRWGLGMVMRTEEGKCVGAATRVVRGCEDALEGEALGLQAALDLLEHQAVHDVTIEMDSKTFVDSIQKGKYHCSYWGRIAHRCSEFIDAHPKACQFLVSTKRQILNYVGLSSTLRVLGPSYFKIGIKEEVATMFQNSIWLLGNGEDINFWNDNWCGTPLSDTFNIPDQIKQSLSSKVSDYIFNGQWNLPCQLTHQFSNLSFLVQQITIPNEPIALSYSSFKISTGQI